MFFTVTAKFHNDATRTAEGTRVKTAQNSQRIKAVLLTYRRAQIPTFWRNLSPSTTLKTKSIQNNIDVSETVPASIMRKNKTSSEKLKTHSIPTRLIIEISPRSREPSSCLKDEEFEQPGDCQFNEKICSIVLIYTVWIGIIWLKTGASGGRF
jgi:hypothetical protein